MAVALVAVVLHLFEAGLDLADVRVRGTVRLALVVLVLLLVQLRVLLVLLVLLVLVLVLVLRDHCLLVRLPEGDAALRRAAVVGGRLLRRAAAAPDLL